LPEDKNMKLALAIPTPEVSVTVPVALFSGTFAQRLQKAARSSYAGVELMVARPAELSAGEIADAVACRGLEIAAIASGAVYMVDGLTLMAEDASVSHRAQTRLGDLIDFAAAVHAPLVTVGGFRGRLASCGPGARETLIGILRRAATYGSDRGVRLALEPLNRYETDCIHNTQEGLDLLSEVGADNLGLLLDTYHVNIEESSVTECFRQAAAAGKLWHVHLGDSNRLAPGWGHTDFPGIVAALRDVGYRGYVSAELLALPDPDSAGEATMRHMSALLAG